MLPDELEIKVNMVRKEQLRAIKKKIADGAKGKMNYKMENRRSKVEMEKQSKKFLNSNPILSQNKNVRVELDKINLIKKRNYGGWYLKPD